MANDSAGQVTAEKDGAKVPGAPKEGRANDEACAGKILSHYGRLLFRLPLTDAELDNRVGLSRRMTERTNDFYAGLGYSLSMLLQLPDFIFRSDAGQSFWTRFRSVAASSSGDAKQSYSSLGGTNLLPSEPTPLSLYARLFGPGFQDPTKGYWEARSANPDAEERAIRGGRRPQARHAEPGRQRPGPHGSVLHLRASNRAADGGRTPTPQH